MPVVYIIQVMAHHGYGLEGWRTVRKTSREPYCFETYEAAHSMMREHFANLREGINVRVHTMEADEAALPLAVQPVAPGSRGMTPSPSPAEPSPQ